MKAHLSILALLFTCIVSGQIRVTPEGYPLMPKKPAETTMADNDSIPFQKDDGILRAISFFDFKALLPAGGGGSTYFAGEGLNLNTDEFSVDSTKVILLDANSPELGIVQIAIGSNAQLDLLPAPVGYKRLAFSTDGDGMTPINSGDYLSKPEYDADNDQLIDGVDANTVGSTEVIDGSIQNQDIQSGTINFDKISNISESIFLGRPTGLGTGSIQQVSASAAKTILNYQADEVDVDDVGGHFSSTDIEGVTQELGASLNVIDSDGDGLVSGVENGTIGTNQLANNSVTNAKMTDASVNTSELANQSVTTPKLSTSFYENSNFTPTFVDAGGGATYNTSSTPIGEYTRIGNTITIRVFANITSTTGTPTGEFRIGNLPLLDGNNGYSGSGAVNLVGIYMVGIDSASGQTIMGDNVIVESAGNGYLTLNRDVTDSAVMTPMYEVGFIDGQISFTIHCIL